MERVAGIEPALSDWKSGVISHYTTPAQVRFSHSSEKPVRAPPEEGLLFSCSEEHMVAEGEVPLS